MASGEQYVRLFISFALVASISRVLTPSEVGVSVIGTSIIMLAIGLREFASAEYLIQRRTVDRDDIRSVFTALSTVGVIVTCGIIVLAPLFGHIYDEPRLALYLRVCAIAAFMEVVAAPTIALLRREMSFGRLAVVNVASAMVNAVAAVGFALSDLSYMSIAWAAIAGSGTMLFLCLCMRPDFTVFVPKFRSWSGVLNFGAYAGLTFMVNKAYETLPQLVLGQVLNSSAVGIYNRSSLVSGVPDRLVLTGVAQVAFPAFAAQVREAGDVKKAYLSALGFITAFYWPGQILLALLAYPVVMLLLGNQWGSAVPLVRIMAIASFAWFPVVLTTPVLLSLGENRDRLKAELVGRPIAAVILCLAAYHGVLAMALIQFITLPFQMLVALLFVRRHIRFSWAALGAALYKSAIVTVCAATGPVAVIALNDFSLELSFGAAVSAGLLAVPCWLGGVFVARHPVRYELEGLLEAAAASSFARRCIGPLQRVIG
jgi:O-antigen/teichoic acid export membrane protein